MNKPVSVKGSIVRLTTVFIPAGFQTKTTSRVTLYADAAFEKFEELKTRARRRDLRSVSKNEFYCDDNSGNTFVFRFKKHK